jgi:hypothetical protein
MKEELIKRKNPNKGRCSRCSWSIYEGLKLDILFCEKYQKLCQRVAFNCKAPPSGY